MSNVNFDVLDQILGMPAQENKQTDSKESSAAAPATKGTKTGYYPLIKVPVLGGKNQVINDAGFTIEEEEEWIDIETPGYPTTQIQFRANQYNNLVLGFLSVKMPVNFKPLEIKVSVAIYERGKNYPISREKAKSIGLFDGPVTNKLPEGYVAKVRIYSDGYKKENGEFQETGIQFADAVNKSICNFLVKALF